MDPMVESAFIAAAATLVGVGGTVAVAIVVARMARTTNEHILDAAHHGQVTDRYTKAVDQLGSPNLDVRRGGIYALERIARDSDLTGHFRIPVVTIGGPQAAGRAAAWPFRRPRRYLLPLGIIC